ncbi:MAG TPA: AglZ/HisF2 family acetamidino modification protein [Flavipsychrobacter sp.]|nr:AglZ/HisF2 family acetamidino modification protein [Flavipsychrobacter sp.]
MKRVRVIPVLLLKKGGLVKTERFKAAKYVGDPINAVKIFNEKEVDEIVLLDISATSERRGPDFETVKKIVSEAFMPLAYGGGITTIQQVSELIQSGVEKIILGTSGYTNTKLISEAAKQVGSQSVVVCLDVKKNWRGKSRVYVQNGTQNTDLDPATYAKRAEDAGAGELFLQAIEKDGSFKGYDLDLISDVSNAVNIPVVALGGASEIDDFTQAIQKGASAVAAGSFFVFQRPHKAVLISYPTQKELKEKLFTRIA